MKSLHFLRIHKKVWRRLWSDLTDRMRDTIAADVDHSTEQFKWFEQKVNTDAERLYQDPQYFDNAKETFAYSDAEPFVSPIVA